MILSIIIVNWNVCELLRDCLCSIAREVRLPEDTYEVIVVDNASTDRSAEMVRSEFPDVTLVASPENLGFAAGCNAGYARSSGSFVLLLNPDTVLLGAAVDDLLSELQVHADAGVLGARLLNPDRSFQRSSGGAFPTLGNVAWNYLFINRLLPRRIAPPPLYLQDDPQGTFEVDWVSGAAMLLRREALGHTIFDEAYFMFGEDMEVCDRLRRQGWRVLYTSRASVLHYHGRSFEKQGSMDVLSNVVKGPRKFFERNHGRCALFLYDFILFVGYLVRWPAFAAVALIRPGHGYRDLSAFSRRYVFILLRSLWGAR